MRHSKQLLVCAFLKSKPHPFQSGIHRNLSIQNTNHLLTKILFQESNLRSREFQTNERELPLAQHIRQSINRFPYCKLPKYTQKFSEESQITPQDYQKIVAFGCLFVFNEDKMQKELSQMAQILLKQEFESIKNQNLTGERVFHLHYIKKLPQILKQVNEGKISEERMTFCLQVLTNMMATAEVKNCVEKIKEQKIFKLNPHIQSLFVKLLLKHELPSIHAIDKLYTSIVNKENQTQETEKIKLEAAKNLFSIHNYEQLLSANMKNEAMKIIIENINNMKPIDHIEIIKYIYTSDSQQCKAYIEKVTEEITKMHAKNRGQEIHVPLMLKVIKYRSKINLSNDIFLQIIKAYPEKFNTVFRERNMNKEIFMTLTSKGASDNLNMEVRNEFGSFIQKIFAEYERTESINEDELIRNIKLIQKYGKDLKVEQTKQVLSTLVNKVYERAKHEASDELKYHVFLVTHTFIIDQGLEVKELAKEVAQIYHQKCLSSPSGQDISRMINIEYHFCRKGYDQSLRQNIFQYNYSNLDLQGSVYSYLIYLMKRGNSKGSVQQKKEVLNQLKGNIYKKLSQQKFSMKVIYTLIDVLEELNFDDRYIYMDIERSIGKYLARCLSEEKGKKNELPLPKDISFLRRKLEKDEKCSKKFREFLIQSEKNYDMISKFAQEYLQNSQNWENMRANFKKNRQKEAEKYLKKNNSTE